MDLYARVNIQDGASVRLPHGDVAEPIHLDNDPIGRACHWAELGADIIHVVDLNAAAFGDYVNRPLIDRMIDEVPIPVQVAGGVRSHVEAKRLIDVGAYRVVMGTAAIEDQNMVWDLCREHPWKIVVSLDVRPDEELAIRGWTENSGRYLEEVLLEMSSAGVAAFLVAEAGRDALTEPPDFRILLEALGVVTEPVIAAGGVRDLEDLRRLLALEADGRRLAGVIVGREVTHGRFTIEQAKEVIAAGPPPPEEVPEPVTEVAPESLRAAELYREVADECDRAAAHARIASQHHLEGDTARGPAHGLSVAGHLARIQDLLAELAKLQAHTTRPER